MQISILPSFSSLFYFSLIFSPIQGFAPSPAPASFAVPPSVQFLSPASGFYPPEPALSEAPAPMTTESGGEGIGAPVPAPEDERSENEVDNEGQFPAPGETGSGTVRWCAVREEFWECQHLVSLLKQSDDYTWECVKQDTTQECLEAIKKGEADLINLEAGLAYTAFLNYSMKAIANEVYCDHTKSYDAVAVVSRKACREKEGISLMNFKGHRSCHGGYSTAAGWNYPINLVKELFDVLKMNDREIATNFFSEVCAPSELGAGVCSGCGNENGTCHSNNLYFGHSGAFRCLVEELGDIAFVKGDTALLYSMEGPHNQSWSTKSIRDFMYLCPQGGCREINGFPGAACSFGSVPANVIMASNSIPNKKRMLILKTLSNATWIDALYATKGGASHVLSPSTQELEVVQTITRSFLGKSASISQRIQELNNPDAQVTVNSVSDESSSCVHNSQVTTLMLVLTTLMLLVFTPK